jgi:hypothetical protein
MIEDTEGHSMPLLIENHLPVPAVVIPYQRILDQFPIGSIYAIREPYVHFNHHTGLPQLRVNVPTDLQPLSGDGSQIWKYPAPGRQKPLKLRRPDGYQLLYRPVSVDDYKLQGKLFIETSEFEVCACAFLVIWQS